MPCAAGLEGDSRHHDVFHTLAKLGSDCGMGCSFKVPYVGPATAADNVVRFTSFWLFELRGETRPWTRPITGSGWSAPDSSDKAPKAHTLGD